MLPEKVLLEIRNKCLAEDITPVGFDEYSFNWITKCLPETIVKWRNDDRILGMMRVSRLITLDMHLEFLANYQNFDRYDFILFDEAKNTPVGCFNITNITGRPEIGKYIGDEHYLGKGLAKRATNQLLVFAKDIANIHAIFAETKINNINNIELNQHLGFEIIGENSSGYFIMRKYLNQ